MRQITMNKQLAYALAISVGLLAPMVMYPVLLMKVLCLALFACAFNLLIGFIGLMSFGHAAFFGFSAYVAGWSISRLGLPFEVGLLVGMTTGAVLGIVIGGLAIRRRGIYFTMITMALAQMVYFVCLQAPFTGGEDGLQGVPRGYALAFFDLSSNVSMYYAVLVVFMIGFMIIDRTINSPFGEIVAAIKDNEARATSLGYDVNRYKLMVFVISAALSGLAGAAKAVTVGFVTLSDVHWTMSGAVILMTLVGGLGTLSGPVVGAFVIVLLENKLGDLGSWLSDITKLGLFSAMGESVTFITGLVFAICVLTFRQGIVGEIERLSKRARSPSSVVRHHP